IATTFENHLAFPRSLSTMMNTVYSCRQTDSEVQMGDRPALGDQELALLRFLGDRPSISVRDVVKEFGETNGLARTTVLTMLERLRKKGFIERSRTEG